MSLHRATRDLSAPVAPEPTRQPTGPAVLFIAAVLIAGLTCVLYLWQQSQIVAGRQDLQRMDRDLTVLLQQRDDLLAQKQDLQSVTRVVSAALKFGMIQGDSRNNVAITVPAFTHTTTLAQTTPDHRRGVILPATNAAITFWWQNAWDGLYSLMQ